MKFTYCKRPELVSKQRGSAIVLALFILVVLGLLAAVLLRLLADANRNVAIEVYGARAYLAAQSGAELGLTYVFPLSGNGSCADVPVTDGGRWQAIEGLHHCSVTLRCEEAVAPSPYQQSYYTITSEAVCQTEASHNRLAVARTIEVRARQMSWDE